MSRLSDYTSLVSGKVQGFQGQDTVYTGMSHDTVTHTFKSFLSAFSLASRKVLSVGLSDFVVRFS